jgi:predicted HAD superfamily phosphohydrolase YqeG
MIQRILFSLTKMCVHRRALREALHHSSPTILQLTPTHLKPLCNVLVLDFDGVLASHGKPKPLPSVEDWLAEAVTTFGDKIYVLSNKPNAIRHGYFAEHFPTIQFVSGFAKKPYPDGLNHIIKTSKAKPQEVLLIDDRLLAGTQCMLITQAFQDLSAHPIVESFFGLLRAGEKLLICLIT